VKLDIEFDRGQDFSGIEIGLLVLRGLIWPLGSENSSFFSKLDTYQHKSLEKISSDAIGYLEARKKAVRSMLRYGAYKPAGRGKPSNEYLLQAAHEGDFPAVNCFVDAVNAASLRYMFPMSIFDADKSGGNLLVRRGRESESYVFNSGGQSIDLHDLLCICRKQDAVFFPCVNPVRDSMATKLFPGAKNAAVAIYSPSGVEANDLDSAGADLANLLAGFSESVEFARFTALKIT
jgi:DNA/RNA-binding domain of Phe-tRNA-synthetase-like protein